MKLPNYKNFLNEALDINKVSEFFGKLFQSRDITHLNHLASKSNAEHTILNEYYDDILDLIDSLIENYQGNNNIINIKIPSSESNMINSLLHLENLKYYIEKNKDIFSGSDLQNHIDDILSLLGSTIYKLKNLA